MPFETGFYQINTDEYVIVIVHYYYHYDIQIPTHSVFETVTTNPNHPNIKFLKLVTLQELYDNYTLVDENTFLEDLLSNFHPIEIDYNQPSFSSLYYRIEYYRLIKCIDDECKICRR